MASPLNNFNTVHATQPSSAGLHAAPDQLVFGRPVQALQHTDKQLPSSAPRANIAAPEQQSLLDTLLIRTIWTGDAPEVQRLLKQGANPNHLPGDNSRPPLSWACWHGDLPTVEILLEAGALVELREHGGLTPLAWAVHGGHREVVHHLLKSGADVNAACKPYQAPLYRALGHDNDMAEILLKAGAAPDLLCEQEVNRTPLMIAAQLDCKLAELLVDYGADIHRKDHKGLSAIEHAEQNGFHPIAAMLRVKAALQAARTQC